MGGVFLCLLVVRVLQSFAWLSVDLLDRSSKATRCLRVVGVIGVQICQNVACDMMSYAVHTCYCAKVAI